MNYVPPMSIDSFSPGRIDEQGEHMILIFGKSFPDLPGLACRFGGGGTQSTSPALWSSSTLVRCLTPPLYPGRVVVEITFNGVDFVAAPESLSVATALTVMGISPRLGPVGGGTEVTVTGTGFGFGNTAQKGLGNSALYCLFGDSPAIATPSSAGSVRCHAPPGFGNSGANAYGVVTVTIAKRDEDGAFSGVSFSPERVDYLYLRDSVLTRAVPDRGPSAGGTQVALSGLQDDISYVRAAGMEPDFRCIFGAVVNATMVLTRDRDGGDVFCIAPPMQMAVLSNATVSISLNGGADYFPSEAVFFYFETPAIGSVTPSTVSVDGGSIVTLEGLNFPASEGFECVFGPDSPAAEGTWISSTTLQCISPPHQPGFALVSAIFNGVDVTASTALLEFHEALSISSISPAHAAVTSGTDVTLRGSGFVNSSLLSLRWRVQPEEHSSPNVWYTSALKYINATAAKFSAPHHVKDGEEDDTVLELAVSNNGLNYVQVDGAVHIAIAGRARVLEAFPRYGSAGGGTVVSIVGGGFVPAVTSCLFGLRQFNGTGGALRDYPPMLVKADVRNSTHLTCVTPEVSPGNYFIEVVVGAREEQTALTTELRSWDPFATAGFTFFRRPSVITFEPAIFPESGGATISIEGFNLTHTGLEACRFGGGEVVDATLWSESLIRCQVPPASPGLVTVEVTLNGADWMVVPVRARYEPDRFVYSLSPSAGPLSGGSHVVVTGVGFANSTGTEERGVFFCSFGNLEVSYRDE